MNFKYRIILTGMLLISLSSCRKSKIDECIDSKVKQGMSTSDAREECEEAYYDSQIRR